MALKETISKMRNLLDSLSKDLDKASGGNKAASQRVRTGSIKLEKIAKVYRKESVAADKKVAKAPKKAAAKKTSAKKSAKRK